MDMKNVCTRNTKKAPVVVCDGETTVLAHPFFDLVGRSFSVERDVSTKQRIQSARFVSVIIIVMSGGGPYMS